MQEFLTTLIQSIVAAAIPVIVAFVSRWLNIKAKQTKEAINSDLADRYIDEAQNAVITAVEMISQTFVDGLKADGNFIESNQKKALAMALSKAKELLTSEASKFLTNAYGDLNKYIITQIEGTIHENK